MIGKNKRLHFLLTHAVTYANVFHPSIQKTKRSSGEAQPQNIVAPDSPSNRGVTFRNAHAALVIPASPQRGGVGDYVNNNHTHSSSSSAADGRRRSITMVANYIPFRPGGMGEDNPYTLSLADQMRLNMTEMGVAKRLENG